MSPDLTSIELFLKAVKLGNLSRAAEHSHLSLSAASRRLSLLEQHSKIALLTRTSTGVSPTAAGERLAQLHGRAGHSGKPPEIHGDHSPGVLFHPARCGQRLPVPGVGRSGVHHRHLP